MVIQLFIIPRCMASQKRDMADMDVDDTKPSEWVPIFEQFRDALDEHHDRRERVIKASRDVTAQSKKM
jgi:hypothetical protein